MQTKNYSPLITIPIIMTWKAPRQGKALPRKKLSHEELVIIQNCLIGELEAKKAQAITKRIETADAHIEGHKKRITARLLANAQTFALGPNILSATLEQKRFSDIIISPKETKGYKNSIHFAEKYLHWRKGTKQKKNKCLLQYFMHS